MPLKSFAYQSILFLSSIMLMISVAKAEEANVWDQPPSYIKHGDGSVDVESIPQLEADWQYFVRILILEDDEFGAGRELLKESIGIDDNKADELLNFMRSAREDVRRNGKDRHDEVCSRMPNTMAMSNSASRATVASVIKEMIKRGDDERAMYSQLLFQALDPTQEAILMDWIDKRIRSTMQIASVDWDEFLSQKELVIEDIIDRVCNPPNYTIR